MNKNQFLLEINHIVDSGINNIRLSEYYDKNFLNLPYFISGNENPKKLGGVRYFCYVKMKNGNTKIDIKTWNNYKWILDEDEDGVIKWLNENM